MFTLKQVLLLAVVGTAYAAPLAHRREDHDGPRVGRVGEWATPTYENGATGTVNEVVTTITVYAGKGGNRGSGNSPAASSSVPAAAQTSTPSTGTGTGTDDSSSGSGSDTGYMSIVNKWRKAGGYTVLTQSSKLEGNALKTAQDGNGQMVHELNSGSMAQVLAPGSASDFEKVYVGGWLCEKPNDPGMSGVCPSFISGWDHSSGQTGHAEILTGKYTNIGCALAKGIWACDLS